MLVVRPELLSDAAAIEELHLAAFKGPAEGMLVRLLRADPAFVSELSLIAMQGERMVGHALFSKISLCQDSHDLNALSLAPVGVLPSAQRTGIGRKLIERGIERARDLGFRAILVLGEPAYYGRFGFRTELAERIASPYSGKHFAGIELRSGTLLNLVKATAMYPSAFSAVD